MDNQWFYAVDGGRFGPLPESQLAAIISQGRLTAQTLVWREGMADWAPLPTVSELAKYLAGRASAPPATPPSAYGVYQPIPAHAALPMAPGTEGPGLPRGFFDAIGVCLTKKYATFSGRASRSEFWWFVLFYFILSFVAGVVQAGDEQLGAILVIVAGLGLFLPNIAVTVRRLHDTDRSGWWFWISLVPFIGLIVLLVFMCMAPTPGRNRFNDA